METLFEKIKNGEAGAELCTRTKEVILADQEIYMLAGDKYLMKVDIDSEIEKLSEGEFKTKDEAYDDEDDWYYYTTNDQDDEVYGKIMRQGYYYDLNSNKISIYNEPDQNNL